MPDEKDLKFDILRRQMESYLRRRLTRDELRAVELSCGILGHGLTERRDITLEPDGSD